MTITKDNLTPRQLAALTALANPAYRFGLTFKSVANSSPGITVAEFCELQALGLIHMSASAGNLKNLVIKINSKGRELIA